MELLDKSRSAISRTHTVSQAPAPSLAPATIAQALASNSIITTLHSLDEDVNDLVYYNALDDASLRQSSLTLLPILQGKAQAISDIITTNQNAQVSASERTRKLWNERKAELEKLLVIYANADNSEDELSTEQAQARKAFFDIARNIWQTKLPDALATFDKEFVGPYTLGNYRLKPLYASLTPKIAYYMDIQVTNCPSLTCTLARGSLRLRLCLVAPTPQTGMNSSLDWSPESEISFHCLRISSLWSCQICMQILLRV